MVYEVEFQAVLRKEREEVVIIDGVVIPPARQIIRRTRIVTDPDPALLETTRRLLFPREEYEWREMRIRRIEAS